MITQTQNGESLNGFYWNGASMTVSGEGQAVIIDTSSTGGNGVKLASGTNDVVIGIILDNRLYQTGQEINLVGKVGQVCDILVGYAGINAGYAKADATTIGSSVSGTSSDHFYAYALSTGTSGNFVKAIFLGGR